jgi:hypothetical protein
VSPSIVKSGESGGILAFLAPLGFQGESTGLRLQADDPGVIELTGHLGFLEEAREHAPVDRRSLTLGRGSALPRITFITRLRRRSSSQTLRIAPIPPRAISPCRR